MTFDEFRILAKGMKAVFTSPNFLPDADSVKIWYQLLQDLDYKVANAAIQKYMLTQKFPPTIADIREQATSVSIGEKPLWSDGWEEVLMAIRRYGSYQESLALESMSDITRQAVQRLGFRNICMSENIMADRANFRMIYEQIVDREYDAKKIPEKVLSLISSIRMKGEENLLEADPKYVEMNKRLGL